MTGFKYTTRRMTSAGFLNANKRVITQQLDKTAKKKSTSEKIKTNALHEIEDDRQKRRFKSNNIY